MIRSNRIILTIRLHTSTDGILRVLGCFQGETRLNGLQPQREKLLEHYMLTRHPFICDHLDQM